jgi:hypothetical protein
MCGLSPVLKRASRIRGLTMQNAIALGFVDTFRTICIDTPAEIRATFEMLRNSWEPV